MTASWISFHDAGQSPSGKTRRWVVMEGRDGPQLGSVLWWAPWRCYAFQPIFRTVFEHKCLREIADFCERETVSHKKKVRVPERT